MQLQKQGIDISFAQGIDTKTDPKRVTMGKFLQMQNSVFTNMGLLQKRNGYASLTALPNSNYTYLTTFNGNLTAVGSNIAAYNSQTSEWFQKGSIHPLSLSTLPVIRNNLNQISWDIAVAPNGLGCVVYQEQNGTAISNKFAIYDTVTGQNLFAPTFMGSFAVASPTGAMRVFVLGNYFVMISTYVSGGNSFLQYLAINYNTPANIAATFTLSNAYVPSQGMSWDAYVAGNNLYYAYSTTSGIECSYLTSSLVNTGLTTLAGYTATLMSVCADTTGSNPVIYLNFASSNAYAAALDQNLNIVMAPVETLIGASPANITASAQNGVCQMFYEQPNNYLDPPFVDANGNAIPTNFIGTVLITPNYPSFTSVFSSGATTMTASSSTGLVSGMYLVDNTTPANIAANTTFTISGTTLSLSAGTNGASRSSPGDSLTAVSLVKNPGGGVGVVRSVGLASKSFIYNGATYFLAVYQSAYQPTYFLINAASNGSYYSAASPIIAAKLAYENGGGYLTYGLPNVSQNGSSAYLGYLFKDLIEAVNKNTNTPTGTQAGGIYSQTGINMAQIVFGTSLLDTAETGHDLHISGGFLSMYDGYLPVEHNFFLWPDNVAVTAQTDPVTTGNTTNTSKTVSSLASTTGIAVGLAVSGTGIPANTTVTNVSGSTITISNAATATASGVTLTFTGQQVAQAYYYQVTYEWSDNQGNIFRSAPSIPVTVTTTSGHSSVSISIPTLRLTMKTANPVKIVIYRWSTAQQFYYQVTSISSPLLNGTTIDSVTYVDGLSDTEILGNNLIYTTGGVVEDINAPASNLMTLFDTRLWLVDAEDPNLVWFSKQVIESTPVEMSDLLTVYIPQSVGTTINTGPITAIATMDDKVLFAKSQSWVYINGTGPDNTGQNSQYSQPIFITSTAGCTNQKSIVLTPNGLMFQSDKGIWLIGRGLDVSYIGAPVQALTQGALVTSAVLVPDTTQVRFTLNTGVTLMYDYYYDQWGTFTVSAISSVIYQNLHTFLSSSGSVYQESVGTYLDGTSPVNMMFQTGPLRLGDLQNYQRFYFFYLLGTYYSPHLLTINMTYDYEPSSSQTTVIQPGAQTGIVSGSLEDWRIFAARQRCMSVSLTIQESYDSTLGPAAGQGFSLSGINIVLGFKKGFRPQPAAQSAG